MNQPETLVVIGVVVSGAVQFIKKYSPNQYYTLGAVALASLIGAAVYQALVATGYWEGFLSIVTIAGAIYTYIIQRFEA